MTFTPSDISAMLNEATSVKQHAELVLTKESLDDLRDARDKCTQMVVSMESLLNYYAKILEGKRRDIADTRQERDDVELRKKELSELSRRLNSTFWSLKNDSKSFPQ